MGMERHMTPEALKTFKRLQTPVLADRWCSNCEFKSQLDTCHPCIDGRDPVDDNVWARSPNTRWKWDDKNDT